jgi:CRP-like cAMP-binding protein
MELFVQRLAGHSRLSAEEQGVILGLPTTLVHYPAHVDIVRLGVVVDHACLVSEGLVGRYGQTGDGKRQFLSLHLPGEMIDLPSVVAPQATSALNALAPTTVLKVPHAALREIGLRHPAIAAAFWRDCVLDASILSQWLVNVGRRDARTRTAHLVCELAVRSRRFQVANLDHFALPITQEQMADALGLTPVHVNRVLKGLREERLMTLTRGRVTIEDWRALTAAAEFDTSYLAGLAGA